MFILGHRSENRPPFPSVLSKKALPPSARYERRVGVSLVRAAWERRPEGPAYLLSSVTLLYLAGQCASFGTHLPPWIQGTRTVFPEFLRIPDLSPPAVFSPERDPTVQEA